MNPLRSWAEAYGRVLVGCVLLSVRYLCTTQGCAHSHGHDHAHHAPRRGNKNTKNHKHKKNRYNTNTRKKTLPPNPYILTSYQHTPTPHAQTQPRDFTNWHRLALGLVLARCLWVSGPITSRAKSVCFTMSCFTIESLYNPGGATWKAGPPAGKPMFEASSGHKPALGLVLAWCLWVSGLITSRV